MTTIQEMVAQMKERKESNTNLPEFQKFVADLKAKAEADNAAKEAARAEARAKFADMIAKAKAKAEEQKTAE